MVRNYKRKTIDTYYRETLLKAIQKVKNKEMSACKAATIYGVPRSTLNGHVSGRRGIKNEGRGRPTAFTSSFEKNMATVLHSMEQCGFNLTKRELLALVSNYATRNNITTKFKNNLPGHEWFVAFTKRHKLTLKKFQPPSITRKPDPFIIYGFYELLHNAIERLDIHPSRIYCFCETIFNIDDAREIVDILPYCSKMSSHGENSTVLLATNVYGEKITPLITSKQTVLWNDWLYNKAQSPKSRMNSRVFENYFENIVFPMLCTNKTPLLIIYDGRSTHLDIQILNKAAKNNITVIKLPPNTSALQPLDDDIKNAIKDNLEKRLFNWKHDNVGKVEDDVLSCFISQAWEETDPSLLNDSLKKAGIWPVNRNKFPLEIFEETALTDWEKYVNNEDRILNEPFLVKKEILESELNVEDETMDRDNNMEINFDGFDSNSEKDDELSNGTDNVTNFEFKPSYEEIAECRVDITKMANIDKQKKISQETVQESDPLSEPILSQGLNNLTRAINNLCGELGAIRKEMFGLKQEVVKMTTTMADFNKRMEKVEKKLPS